MVNINLALAILAINTPAPVRATLVVLAPPATASTNPALVHLLTLGATVLALAPQLINTPAPVRATPAVPALLVAASMRLVPAPLATNGKMVVARNKHRMEQLASGIIAMAKLLVYVLQVWASMSR